MPLILPSFSRRALRTGRPGGPGFTLIEMLIAISVVAILLLLALPNYTDKIVRDQITEALAWADVAKKPVAEAWAAKQKLPADNAAAGLPAADKLVSNLVSSVVVEGGALHITFGNRANGALKGKVVTLRPAIVPDAPIVPVAWVCGGATPPDKMTAQGTDKTNVEPVGYLPLACRPPAKPSK